MVMVVTTLVREAEEERERVRISLSRSTESDVDKEEEKERKKGRDSIGVKGGGQTTGGCRAMQAKKNWLLFGIDSVAKRSEKLRTTGC
ncbi:hypothetical protein LWI29_032989 [Acer saccharum]|uniref:Uncharacterized protein n=1 Tax=Acer saccharum TaxID=4024 RepID=A0AA39W938_ACESA|nr:hypothetical protein LWI29_032989 [Acer saccharum]